jgi:hypothetical protein
MTTFSNIPNAQKATNHKGESNLSLAQKLNLFLIFKEPSCHQSVFLAFGKVACVAPSVHA